MRGATGSPRGVKTPRARRPGTRRDGAALLDIPGRARPRPGGPKGGRDMAPAEPAPHDVGERLRAAREGANLTQAAAAAGIDVARTTLVAIEKGQRRIRPGELQRLARLYDMSVNALLRREAVHVDLAPRFRGLRTGARDAADAAVQLLTRLVRAEVELENLLGVQRTHNYPPERPILRGDVRAQAEADAQELRQWLGLGQAPVRDLTGLLEIDLGVRVYVRRLDPGVSGLFAHDDRMGACMLLNADHPPERRTLSGGHGLGHLVSTRRRAEILHADGQGGSPGERYANAFGLAFLTPARAVKLRFSEITAGATHLTRRHVILLAHAFGIPREAMVRRLEGLKLTRRGTWDWFRANGGITSEQARRTLGDLAPVDTGRCEADLPTTLRLNQLAAAAWHRGILSEGQLARMLDLDRVALRGILADVETEGNGANGMPKLPG